MPVPSSTHPALCGSALIRRRRPAAAIVLLLVAAFLAVVPDHADAAVDPASACPVLDSVSLPDGFLLCTHGDDDHLAEAAAAEPTRASGSVPASTEVCFGDGINGPRVQVLYVHAGTDRSAALAADLQRWSRQVEWTFSRSAERYGGRRHVRFVTSYGPDGRCLVDIRSVKLSSSALGDFAAMVTELRGRGYREPDRKYLVFADSDRYCGLGTAPRDDRPTVDNAANRTAGYARVDRRCWDTGDRGFASTAAHELMHTIGAVQDGAPNATAGAHCTDEHDAMCYSDADGVKLRVRCQDGSSATSGAGDHEGWLFDCGGDDYFRAATASGYLATHWNAANSVFLSARGSDGHGHRGAPRPDVPRDPRDRIQRWPGMLGGAHRPALDAAHGWEACELPIEVHVAEAPATGSSVADAVDTAGDVATGAEPDPILDGAVRSAVSAINSTVGVAVLRYRGDVADGSPAAGEMHMVWGSSSAIAAATHQVASVRISSAKVSLSMDEVRSAPSASRSTYVLHGLAQGLGLGTVPAPLDGLMAAIPRSDARRDTALGALRHLYGDGSCGQDRRLDSVLVLAGSVSLESHGTAPVSSIRALDVVHWALRLLGWR